MYIPFLIPALQTCARCGRTFEIDCGGTPCNPDNPYYQRWICDECDGCGAKMDGKELSGDAGTD